MHDHVLNGVRLSGVKLCGLLSQSEARIRGGGGALLDLGDGLVDGLSDVVDVFGCQAAHVDAPAGHQVDVLLLDHVRHLLGCETHDRERQKLHLSPWQRTRRRKQVKVVEMPHSPGEVLLHWFPPAVLPQWWEPAGGGGATLAGVWSLTVQAGEAEHADLLGDVVPGPRGAQVLQLGLQLIPHQQDAVRHGLHVVLPVETRTQE